MNLGAKNDENGSGGVKTRVRGWFHEMRKKSHVTVQKWVDSISVAASDETSAVIEESEKINRQSCDKSELKLNVEPSTSGKLDGSPPTSPSSTGISSVKGKITEICNKLHVNDKLKSKKIQELKNLLSKTTQNINKPVVVEMDQQDNGEEEVVPEDEEINEEEPQKDQLNVQRCHISVLGRSSSENPPQRTRRLTDIGRSFSVAHDNDLELPVHSSENLIYDADDETITLRSPTSLSNKINSNSHLDRNLGVQQRLLLGLRPVREHTVSEGHYSPQSLPKNQLLRDSSFQSDESHCSSVENLLESRKPDAEAILINLGFGPSHGSDDLVSKIPKRFLKPSQVKGNDTDTFLKNQQLSKSIHESSVLGYRGLLGNSHIPSDVVKAIIHRFSQNELQRMASMENISTQRSFKGVANTILAQRHFMK